jgi:hypothetical protein
VSTITRKTRNAATAILPVLLGWMLVESSCTDEVCIGLSSPDVSSNHPIGFNAAVGAATRAPELDLSALKSGGFRALAYYTREKVWMDARTTALPKLMYNTSVSWNNATSTWDYNPKVYWPGNNNTDTGTDYGKVSFFAYTPVAGLTLSAANVPGTPTLSFTCSPDASVQSDLMAAMTANKTGQNGEKVDFTFHHLLAKIGFKVKTNKPITTTATTVKITNMVVKYKANTLIANATYTFADNSADQGVWTPGAAKMASETGNLFLNNVTVTADGSTLTQVNDNNRFMTLIPQEIKEGDLTFNLAYTITASGETTTYSVSARSLPAIGVMSRNKQYTYVFTLEGEVITFDGITVEALEDGATFSQIFIAYFANGGGGKEVVRESRLINTVCAISDCPFTAPAGLTFHSWNTQQDGSGQSYAPGSSVTPADNVALYAQWY